MFGFRVQNSCTIKILGLAIGLACATQSRAACVDDIYTAYLSPGLTVRFLVSGKGQAIESVAVIFKNFKPHCVVNALNGPFSGGKGSLNQCKLYIHAQGPRFKLEMEGAWNDTNRRFEGTWKIVVDGICPVSGNFSAGGTGGNNNNNDGDDDDDDDDDDGSDGTGGAGSLRVDSGAVSPEAEIIGIDLQINPSLVQIVPGSTLGPNDFTAMLFVRLIYSNGRIVSGKELDITQLKIMESMNGSATNSLMGMTVGDWLDAKDSDSLAELKSMNLDPRTSTAARIEGMPNVLNGEYPVFVDYDDGKFIQETTLRIEAAPSAPGQAYQMPPPPRRLFHRAVK